MIQKITREICCSFLLLDSTWCGHADMIDRANLYVAVFFPRKYTAALQRDSKQCGKWNFYFANTCNAKEMGGVGHSHGQQ